MSFFKFLENSRKSLLKDFIFSRVSDLPYPPLPNSNRPLLANIYLFKVNKKNSRERCEICSNQWHRSGVFVVNFEHISHLSLLCRNLFFNKVAGCRDCSLTMQSYENRETPSFSKWVITETINQPVIRHRKFWLIYRNILYVCMYLCK